MAKKYFYDKSVYDRRYYLKHKNEVLERVRAYREAVKNGKHVPQHRDELYTTREELIKASEEGDGEIDWVLWDKLVQEFHEKYLNEEYLARPKGKKGRVLKLRYVYNSTAQLVCSGSSMEVSEKLKEFGVIMSNDNVVLCCNRGQWIHGFYFTSKHYSGHEFLQLKQDIKNSKTYGNLENFKRLKKK